MSTGFLCTQYTVTKCYTWGLFIKIIDDNSFWCILYALKKIELQINISVTYKSNNYFTDMSKWIMKEQLIFIRNSVLKL